MAIQVTCAACNVKLSLGDDRAGDRVECPQCDAVIKVPYPDGQTAPTRAPDATQTAAPPRKRPVRSDDEPSGLDKRVIAGIAAGVLALLVVGVATVALAARKPKEKEAVAAEPVPIPPAVVNVPPAPPKRPVEPPRPPIDNTPPVPPDVIPDTPPDKQYVTNFLGSQGKGKRFCIVADNSGSMNGPSLANLKVQLLKTLDEMDPNAEYYIYFFNSGSVPMPHPTWLKASAPETADIKRWVQKIPATGGTNPVPSFEAAMKLSPKPDIVFLMTDGIFSPQVPARVTDLNATTKVTVNTILFDMRAFVPPKGFPMPPPGAPMPVNGETQLRQIAEKNGGTFTRYTPPAP